MSPLPDVGDFIFLFVLDLMLFVLPDQFFSDGSTGWHLLTGDFIFQNRAVPHQDLISYTFADKAWVAYEWLFDLIISSIVKAGGLTLLSVILTCLLGFLFLYLYDRCRSNQCGIVIASVITVTAILTSATHFLARPHLVTFFGAVIFLAVLENFYAGIISSTRLLTVACLTMLIWTNCHPGFPIGVLLISIFLIVAFMESILLKNAGDRDRSKQSSRILLAALVAVCLVTLFNPYGIALHEYILRYLSQQDVLKITDEYMSPVFHGGLHASCLEIIILTLLSGLALSSNRLKAPTLLVCLVFLLAALTSVRHMPLFVILVAPSIAVLWSRTRLSQRSKTQIGNSALGRFLEIWRNFEAQERRCKMHLLPKLVSLVLIVIALCGGKVMDIRIIGADFNKKTLPSSTLTYIKDHGLADKPGLNYDNWGGYLRLRLGKRVFIDDRTDFYDRQFCYRYSVMMATANGWRKYLADSGVDWVLFPNNSRLARTLSHEHETDWRLIAKDQAASLFVRKKKRENAKTRAESPEPGKRKAARVLSSNSNDHG